MSWLWLFTAVVILPPAHAPARTNPRSDTQDRRPKCARLNPEVAQAAGPG